MSEIHSAPLKENLKRKGGVAENLTILKHYCKIVSNQFNMHFFIFKEKPLSSDFSTINVGINDKLLLFSVILLFSFVFALDFRLTYYMATFTLVFLSIILQKYSEKS